MSMLLMSAAVRPTVRLQLRGRLRRCTPTRALPLLQGMLQGGALARR